MITTIHTGKKQMRTACMVFALIFMCCWNPILAQEEQEELKEQEDREEQEENEEFLFRNERKNIVLLSFGYTYVPRGSALEEEESDGIFVPSIGLDYKRRVSEKWAITLFTDIELEDYLIIEKDFNRERAFIAVLGATYEISKSFGVFGGVGYEFEKSNNLWVLRAGLEYGMDLGKRWVFVPSVFFDWKESYETYSVSIGFSRKF